MEQLPTKEQILRNHYEAFRDANLKYNLSEWDSSDASVEIGVGAMEEYAAVRAMPLVDLLKQIRENIPVNTDVPSRFTYGYYHHLIDLTLSSYTGEQPAQKPFSFTYEELKKFTTDFYFWWHKSKGTNTYSGFDDFMNQQSNQAGEQPLKSEG